MTQVFEKPKTPCFDSAPHELQVIIIDVAKAVADSFSEGAKISKEDGAPYIGYLYEGIAQYLHDAGTQKVLNAIESSMSALSAAEEAIQKAKVVH